MAKGFGQSKLDSQKVLKLVDEFCNPVNFGKSFSKGNFEPMNRWFKTIFNPMLRGYLEYGRGAFMVRGEPDSGQEFIKTTTAYVPKSFVIESFPEDEKLISMLDTYSAPHDFILIMTGEGVDGRTLDRWMEVKLDNPNVKNVVSMHLDQAKSMDLVWVAHPSGFPALGAVPAAGF